MYFEDDEASDYEDGSNEKSRRSQRGRGRGGRKRQEESDAEISESEEESDEREWEDACYKCGGEGELLCCETCPHVCHLRCTGLSREPIEEWHCEDCLVQ